jgi:hypothetical protein
MPGSWHLYPAGERWRKPRHLLRALVAVPGWEAVCFSAPQVQTYRGRRSAATTRSATSGPTCATEARPRRGPAPLRGDPRARHRGRRRAARPAGRGGHRQRLQVRGAAPLPGRPVPARGRRARGRAPPAPRGRRPAAAPQPHHHPAHHGGRARPARSPSTAGPADRAGCAARRSAWSATASRPAAPTGVRAASPRAPTGAAPRLLGRRPHRERSAAGGLVSGTTSPAWGSPARTSS